MQTTAVNGHAIGGPAGPCSSVDFRVCVSLDYRNLLGDSESVFLYAGSLGRGTLGADAGRWARTRDADAELPCGHQGIMLQ